MLPREKLEAFGVNSLSDDELLAIILGTGGKGEDVFTLSKRIIAGLIDISELKNLEYEELILIKGIKKAKATKIIASIELAKRIFKYKPKDLCFNEPKIAFEYLRYDFYGKTQEEFMILFLDKRLKLIKKQTFAMGNGNLMVVDVKEIVKYALKYTAPNLLMIHNHPSNIVEPSEADINCTLKVYQALHLVDITLVDHIIIGQDCYYSFVEQHKLTF